MQMNQHNSLNIENATAQDFHIMIQSGDLPAFLNSYQKARIKELYESGKIWDAIGILRIAIENNNKPSKTLL